MPIRSPSARRVAAALLLALPAASALAQRPSGADPDRAALVGRLDSLARVYVALGNAPSASIAVLRGRDTLLRRAYGTADLEKGVAATPATVYRIGSITKQFTASLVMRLVERGAVALDDPIGRHLPTLPEAWRPATVRQLLTHTSGIPSYTNARDRWMPRLAEPMPPDTLVALTARDTLEFAPGTRWNYDNTGYVVLGMLVERQLGRPYAELVRTELARPLGLTTIRYCENGDTTAATIAHGYVKERGAWQREPYMHMSQPFAAGALCATAGDIARWNGLLAGGRVVRPPSYAAMTTPIAPSLGAPLRYAFGLALDTLGGHPLITHGGSIFGFMSANAYFPADSLSITVLANANASLPDQLLRALAVEALHLGRGLTAAERARYVGSWALALPNGGTLPLRVFEADGRLLAQLRGQGANVLLPVGRDAFGVAFDPSLRITFTVEGERATALTLRQGGRTTVGTRAP